MSAKRFSPDGTTFLAPDIRPVPHGGARPPESPQKADEGRFHLFREDPRHRPLSVTPPYERLAMMWTTLVWVALAAEPAIEAGSDGSITLTLPASAALKVQVVDDVTGAPIGECKK